MKRAQGLDSKFFQNTTKMLTLKGALCHHGTMRPAPKMLTLKGALCQHGTMPCSCRGQATSFVRPRLHRRRVRGEVHECACIICAVDMWGQVPNPRSSEATAASCRDVSCFNCLSRLPDCLYYSSILRAIHHSDTALSFRSASTSSARSHSLTCTSHPLQFTVHRHSLGQHARIRSRALHTSVLHFIHSEFNHCASHLHSPGRGRC